MARRFLPLLLLLCLALPAGDVSPAPSPMAKGSEYPPAAEGIPPRRPHSVGSVYTSGNEIRAFWVDAWNDGFKTSQQIAQLIADAHTAHVNTLVVQVRRRGDSYYNESLEPRAADSALAPPPFDPLAELLEQAHSASPALQVYAWVVAFPVWTPTYTTTDPTRHVYFRHGYGRSWDDPDNWLTYRYNGGNPAPDYQLDPGHPDAARYTVDVCLYLLRHYDLDGLILDYIRYYGQDYGYNKVSVDRFHAAYGGSDLPPPTDPNWMAWRREQVTGVVRRLYLEALAVKPDLVLGAATIAWGNGPDQAGGWENTSAYQSVFQDWRAWLEEGILDLAMPMNYDREHQPPQDQYFRNWVTWEKDHSYGRGVAVVQGGWINYITGTLTQTYVVQSASPSGHYALGIGFYSYASTNAGGRPNSEFYEALSHPSPYGDPPFPTWVEPPTLTWKTAPAVGHLMGWAIGPAAPLDRAIVTLASSVTDTRTLLTDGNGFFGAVDLSPGAYTVTLPAPAASPLYATVKPGRIALATVAPPPEEPGLRALLVDAAHDGFKSPDQVDTLLADARAAHLNALVVQMRRYGQIYYASPMEPRADDTELASGFDPLAYLLEQAHAGDPPLEVYAWMPLLPVWNQDTPPLSPDHVFNRHPEWLSQDVNGNLRSYGEYFLDPGHPGVLSYTVSLLLDLVRRYPLDGLLLDGLGYPYEGSNIGYPIWGYNAISVERFRARCGGSGAPDPGDPLWTAWRREELTALLRQIYLRCIEVRPRLRLAVAAVAWGDSPDYAGGWENSSAYGRLLQDWRAWTEEGIVDLIAPMNYDREYRANQSSWYDHWLNWEAGHAYGRGLWVLQGAYLNYPEHTLAQLGRVPGNAVGLSAYIPSNLYADPEGNSRYIQPPRQPWSYSPEAEWWLWRSLALPYGYTDPATGLFTPTSPLFLSSVPTPTLVWKDAPTLGHAVGLALGPGLFPMTLPTTITLSGPEVRTLRNDGNGFFGAVDLPPGDYIADVEGADPMFRRLVGRVVSGRVTWLRPDTEEWSVRSYLPLLWRK